MARGKSRVAQQRKDIKKLERLGLYKPKASDTVTSYGKSQIRKYGDVLSGRASVVRAKSGKVHVASDLKSRKKIFKELSAAERAKFYRGVLRVKGDRIVVQQPPSSKPRFSSKTGEITIDVKSVGKIQRGRVVHIKISSIDDLRKLESGGFYFALPLQRYGSRKIEWLNYENVDELIQDITQYYKNPKLAKYVVLVPKGSMKGGGSSRIEYDEDEEGDG